MHYEDNAGRKYTTKEVRELTEWQFQELGIQMIYF